MNIKAYFVLIMFLVNSQVCLAVQKFSTGNSDISPILMVNSENPLIASCKEQGVYIGRLILGDRLEISNGSALMVSSHPDGSVSATPLEWEFCSVELNVMHQTQD